MAHALKKIAVLFAAAALLGAFVFAAAFFSGTGIQQAGYADSWDDIATPEPQMEGAGTQISPYLIDSAEDLARMSLWVNSGAEGYAEAYYSLTSDIYLGGRTFTPIGTTAHPFMGRFDGGNHKLSGLNIFFDIGIAQANAETAVGLFGSVGASAQINSFGITSGLICITDEAYPGTGDYTLYAGSVAGFNMGILEDVYSLVNITVYQNTVFSHLRAGGLVGQNGSAGMIRRAANAGDISINVNASGSAFAGGIAGLNAGITENVYNAGSITLNNPYESIIEKNYLGGIAGKNELGQISYVINAGQLAGYAQIGGVAAARNSDTMIYCYYDNYICSAQRAVYGVNDIDQGTNKVKGMTSQAIFESTVAGLYLPQSIWAKYAVSFDGIKYYSPYLRSIDAMNSVYARGVFALRVFGSDKSKWLDTVNAYGGETNPCLIMNAAQFSCFADLVNGGNNYSGIHFKLIGDINGKLDLTGYANTVGTRGLSGGDRPFLGSLDGNNVTITNFVLDRSTATSDALKRNIGLFGYIGAGAHVYNLNLDNTCSVVASEYVGSLAGYNAGKIENIETQASVRGNAFVGGLIGRNQSSAELRDILSNARLFGNVGASNTIYGIVGDGFFSNSGNAWYVVPSSATYTSTGGRGRALIVDIASSVYSRDPITGNITIGKPDGGGGFLYSVTSAKESTGSISFTGYSGDSVWEIQYRYINESLAPASGAVFVPNASSSETRDVYARLVRTVSALVDIDGESNLYFSKSVAGGVATYTGSAKFYKGQTVTMHSEIPEGRYLVRLTALEAEGENLIENPSFQFSYATNPADMKSLIITFTMSEGLVKVAPVIRDIDAPQALTKVYDGTNTVYMAGGVYNVQIPGFIIDYSYSVAGGAPKNVGNYYLTVNVRSPDGILRGRETVSYAITKKNIVLTQDMLTRTKEFDGTTSPVNAPVINQSGITDIIPGDAVTISSTAAYASSEIGWTTADFVFSISGAQAGNYYPPADMNGIACEITRRRLVVQIAPQDLVYRFNGMAAQIPYYGYVLGRAPLTLPGLNPVADVYMSQDVAHTRVNAINVGEYDVNVVLKTGAQYEYNGHPITYYYTIELEEAYIFRITPMPVDIRYSDYEGLVYSGAPQSIRAYYDDYLGIQREVAYDCFTYTLIPGSGSDSRPGELVNAGNYTVLVTLPQGGNYYASESTRTFSLTMSKAMQTGVTISALTGPFVYGDAPRTLSLANVPVNASGQEVFSVLSGNAVIVDGNKLEFTGGGDIYLSASKAGDDNYYPVVTPNCHVKVEKAVLTIDVPDITKIYGNVLNDILYMFSGWAARDVGKSVPDAFVPPTIRITGINVDETLNPYKKYNVGQYTLHIGTDATSEGYVFDYSLINPDPILTVTKRAVRLVPDNKEQTYGRSAGNLPSDLVLTYSVYEGNTPLPVALTGVVLAREEGIHVRYGTNYYPIFCVNPSEVMALNTNYDIEFSTGEYRILQKTLTISVVSQTKIFGQPDPDTRSIYNVAGLAPWDNQEDVVRPKDSTKPLLIRQAGEKAYYAFSNNYGVYYYFESNILLTADYKLSFQQGTLTINKAKPVLVSQPALEVAYGDNIGIISPSAVMRVTVSGETRTVAGSLVWLDSTARPSSASSTFSALFTPAADYNVDRLENNCASVEIQLTVQLKKRRIEPVFATLDFVYTGREQRINYALGNVLEGDVLGEQAVYSILKQVDGQNVLQERNHMLEAGEYTFTLSIENANYTFYHNSAETDALVLNIVVQKAPLLIYLEDIELGETQMPLKNFIYEGFVRGEGPDNLLVKPDVIFHTEPGNYEITPFGAVSENYQITYRTSRQSVTKTILSSEVQKLTILGSFDFQSALTVEELNKNANKSLFTDLNRQLDTLRTLNRMGNVQVSRLYAIDYTIDGEDAVLEAGQAYIEIPARLRESKKFYVVLVSEDGTLRLAQNVRREGNNLIFDMEDCAMVGIVNPPDYTFIILGGVVILLVIAVFALDMISDRLGLRRRTKR
jgi:hypothetical protein